MARPVSPVIPGLEQLEIMFGTNLDGTQQEGVEILPALRGEAPVYPVYSRWKLTEDERRQIAEGADVYIFQWTFGHQYQPTQVFIADPESNRQIAEELADGLGFNKELDERLKNMLDRAFQQD